MVYVWLGITAIAVIIEFLTNEMLSVWFAGGGLVAIVLALCNVSWEISLIVFIAVSIILLLCFRKMVMRYFLKGETKTNAETAVGEEFILLSSITRDQPGSIKIGDVIWMVVCSDKAQEIQKGEKVKAVDIKGNKYIVEKVD